MFHFSKQYLWWYIEEYCELQCAHSHMGIKANGYSNHQCPYCEKCATTSCDKPRWVCIVIKKWVEDKQNASVIERTNNQTFAG
jgi:hypothetical protein